MATETNIKKFLTALLVPAQDLENALQQLFTERGIDVAVGTQLDIIGKLVGQSRNGLDDDTYRRYVRARISTHRSAGTMSDVLKVSDLVIYDDDASYLIRAVSNASFIIEVRGVVVDATLADVLFQMLRNTVSAGVRFELVTSASPLDETFRFDTGPGWNIGHLAAGRDNPAG